MDLKTLEDTPSWEWPENAGDTLLGVLRNDRAQEADRVLAAELAGEFIVASDEIADALLAILCDGAASEELRCRAVISLGPVLESADTDGFEDLDDVPISEETFLRIQETLAHVFRDAGVPKTVRRRILEASVRAPQDWHRDAVRAAYANSDDEWKLTAVFCMGFVNGFNAQIVEALGNKNPEIRYEAVVAAGNSEVEAAWPHIAALLTSKKTDKPLLLAAIEASVSVDPEKAMEPLVDLMDSDDEDVVAAASEAMAMAEELWGDDDDEDDEDEDEEESCR